MTENHKENLFDIRLNEEGVFYLKKIEKLAPYITVLTLLLSVLYFFTGIYATVSILRFSSINNYAYNMVGVFARNFFIMIVAILDLFYLNRFLRFIKNCIEGIENNDESCFNNSFRFLFSGYIISIATGIINVISLLATFYTVFSRL